MRLLFAIPHYFKPSGGGHGALRADRAARVRALRETVAALHQLFGPRQYLIDIAARRALRIRERAEDRVDVVVCTTGGEHVLADLDLPDSALREHATDAEPRLLGFECHAVLRDGLGDYDHHCYLEDDVVLRDPWFFDKLAWFRETVGEDAVLQPNRYERDTGEGGRKAYVDGDLRRELTEPFQDVEEAPLLGGHALGRSVVLHRPLNPHSGCFFLSAGQMERWAAQPHFLDRDTGFVGPLESAATLGVMRTFRVYKPAPPSASFLEVEHVHPGYIAMIPGEEEEAGGRAG